jgi:hypothetical protein
LDDALEVVSDNGGMVHLFLVGKKFFGLPLLGNKGGWLTLMGTFVSLANRTRAGM